MEVNNYNLEKMFKERIKNEDVYKFLEENNINFEEAMDYFAEFSLYDKNPEIYILKYGQSVELVKKDQDHNPGIAYLDRPYFQETKSIEIIDYKTNRYKNSIIKNFLEDGRTGMYLWSDNGVGKTTLLVALANIYYRETRNKTLFVFWPDFIEKTKRFSEKNYVYINQVKYAPRLIIDDLGNESISQWSRDDILHSVISYRLEQKLPTYVTSNFSLDQLKGMYTIKSIDSKKVKSIMEKIQTLSKPHFVEGTNYRIKGE